MKEFLRDRINRKLDTLPDERLYQVLDYVEFLESKYAERQNPTSNVFQRFAEGVEDRLRAGRVSAQAISQTMNLMNQAMSALSGVAAAGRSVATDIAAVATASARPAGTDPAAAIPASVAPPPGATPTPAAPPATPTAPPAPPVSGTPPQGGSTT